MHLRFIIRQEYTNPESLTPKSPFPETHPTYLGVKGHDVSSWLVQMDLLENAAIADVIVPEVVLSEVQARNKAIHGRLRLLVADKSRRFFVFSNEHHK